MKLAIASSKLIFTKLGLNADLKIDAATRRPGEMTFHAFWCMPFMRANLKYFSVPFGVRELVLELLQGLL